MITRMVHTWGEWDLAVFHGIYGRPLHTAWARLLTVASRSGDGPLYAIIGLLLPFLAPGPGMRFLVLGLAGFAIQLPLYKLIKHLFRRPRPFQTCATVIRRIEPPDRWSFPSGHTASGFLMAKLAAACFPGVAIPAFAWASLIGISRIYHGVHYPTDVGAGALLGLTVGASVLRMAGAW